MRAPREAREMGHGAVQVDHLLLGLSSDEDEIVDRVWAATRRRVAQTVAKSDGRGVRACAVRALRCWRQHQSTQ